jgi:hypothetical protein
MWSSVPVWSMSNVSFERDFAAVLLAMLKSLHHFSTQKLRVTRITHISTLHALSVPHFVYETLYPP